MWRIQGQALRSGLATANAARTARQMSTAVARANMTAGFRFQSSSHTRTARIAGATLPHSFGVRYASTNSNIDKLTPAAPVLDAPSTVSELTVDTFVNAVPHMGEVQAHGLGSWMTPVGVIENLTELSAVTCGSWIIGIAAVTIGFRVALLPLVFKGMRNNYVMANMRPQIVEVQDRAKAYEAAGDETNANATRMKMVELFRENNVSPLKSLIPIVTQMPLFISFFMALRALSNAPIESMTNGGALWFTNLAAPDPYYVLPVLASGFLLATVELGSDGMQQQPFMKTFFRFLSVAMLPMTASFPSAVLVYWITSNAFSLGQLAISRMPVIKKYYNIPELIKHDVETKPFMTQMRETMEAAQQKAANEQKVKDDVKRIETLKATKIPRAPKKETQRH